MFKLESSYIPNGNVKWFSHVEDNLVVPQKSQTELSHHLTIPLVSTDPK